MVAQINRSIRRWQLNWFLQIYLIALISMVLVAPRWVFAESKLYSSVSPQTGTISENFVFTVTFEGSEQNIIPKLSPTGDFEISYVGPKTVIRIHNGHIRSQLSYVYRLVPKRTGTLQTPSASVDVNGRAITAPAISVPISAEPSESTNSTAGKNTFLVGKAEPKVVYTGQQILNTLSLYTRQNLRNIKLGDTTLDGFWQEDVPGETRRERSVAGVPYSTIEIARALYPLRPGALIIPKRSLSCDVIENRPPNISGILDPFNGNFLQDFFGPARVTRKELQTDELSITVKDLPPQPPDHRVHAPAVTIVGSTRMNVEFSQTAVAIGDSREITVTITSNGNLNPLKNLSVEGGERYKLYPGPIRQTRTVQGGMLVMQKSFTFSIVPLKKGVITIPEIKLSYFNPASHTYELLTTGDLSLVVLSNGTRSDTLSQDLTGKPPLPQSTLIPTLPSIEPLPKLEYESEGTTSKVLSQITPTLLLIIVLGLGSGLFILVVLWRIWRRGSYKRGVLKKLQQASCYEEVEQVVFSWLCTTLAISQGTPTYNEFRSQAKKKLGFNSYFTDVILLLDQLETVKYDHTENTTLVQTRLLAIRAVQRI